VNRALKVDFKHSLRNTHLYFLLDLGDLLTKLLICVDQVLYSLAGVDHSRVVTSAKVLSDHLE